jgi:hypothetical protein
METNTTENRSVNRGRKAGFLKRLFRGEVSLPITYWVFGFLIGNVGLRLAMELVELNYMKVAASQVGNWAMLGLYVFVVVYSVFMLIAIWRSAGNYQGRAIWASLARVAVILGVLSLLVGILLAYQQATDSDLALEEEVRMMNRSLPVMVDNETRLDHVSRQDGDYYYSYTLINWLVADIDNERFVSTMTPMLKTSACEDGEVRGHLNEGRKLIYLYRDKTSDPVARIVVQESDCF